MVSARRGGELGCGAVGRGQELVALSHPTAGGVGRCTCIGVQVLPHTGESRKQRGFPCTPHARAGF